MLKTLSFVIILGLIFFTAGVCCAQEETEALRATVSGSGSSSPVPALLDVLLLAGAFACFVISVRVKSFLRDGELASGWTLFSLSFVLLFVSQVLSLSLSAGFLQVSPSIISSLRLLFILLLTSGIHFMKKVLS